MIQNKGNDNVYKIIIVYNETRMHFRVTLCCKD